MNQPRRKIDANECIYHTRKEGQKISLIGHDVNHKQTHLYSPFRNKHKENISRVV